MTPAGSASAPEAIAREGIDRQLEAAGWLLQRRDEMNLGAAPAIAVREFKLHKGEAGTDSPGYWLIDGHGADRDIGADNNPVSTFPAIMLKWAKQSANCSNQFRQKPRPVPRGPAYPTK